MTNVKHKSVKFSDAELAEEPPKEIDFSRVRVLGRGKAGIETARRLSHVRKLARQKASASREYTVVISKDADGWLYAIVAELAGCHTQARTMPALMRRIKEAIVTCSDRERPSGAPSKFISVQRIAVNA
jgi:predicted RNase H-like HicB family nuclease